MTVSEKVIREQACLHCGHKWWPAKPSRPYVCPKCKNARWDKPPRRRKSSTKLNPPPPTLPGHP